MEEHNLAEKILILCINESDSKGPKFVKDSIEALTLSLSEIIKAGYCPEHHKNALEEAVLLMKKDLGLQNE